MPGQRRAASLHEAEEATLLDQNGQVRHCFGRTA